MGDGGGNDGYEQQQAALEAKKQAARDALNLQFGVGSAATAAAPTREQFTKASAGGRWDAFGPSSDSDGGQTWTPETGSIFDQAGFDKAQADYTAGQTNGAARDTLYQTVRDNTFDAGKRGLDENKQKAERNLKFELFAKGLNGGSTDVDENALLGRTYDQGLIDLGGKADAAKADFRGNDESTRLGLLQSIDSGMDQGSALSSAASQLQVNGDRAAAAAQGSTLGDLFANAGLLYSKSQASQGKQAGITAWNGMFPTSPGGASLSGGANGSLTQTPTR